MSPEKKNKETTRFSDPSDIGLQVEKARSRIEALKKQQEELQKEKETLEDLRIKYTALVEGKKKMIESLSNGIALLEIEEQESGRMLEMASETRRQFKDLLAGISSIREDILDDENVGEQIGRGQILIDRAVRALSKARGKIEAFSRSGSGEADAIHALQDTSVERRRGISFAEAVRLGFGLAVPGLIIALIILALVKVLP